MTANAEHPEARALLDAIIADPADDTVRLAYADWLEEHDLPNRAAFIRVQVEAARSPECERPGVVSDDHPKGTRCGLCRPCQLKEHSLGLLNRRVDRGTQQIGYLEWLGPAVDLFPSGFVSGRAQYRRGFLEALEIPWELCRDYLDEIRCEHPVTRVKLEDLPPVLPVPSVGHRLEGRVAVTGTTINAQWDQATESRRPEVLVLLLRFYWPGVTFTLPTTATDRPG
jgi:uncharacterized protein (TIGR02996 family)